MEKTKIDWCDSTWNPVTGCLHNCQYCYARGIVNRFSDFDGSFCLTSKEHNDGTAFNPLLVLKERRYLHINNGKLKCCPYPFGFTPTFHKYKLDEYQNKKGRNIFVCSMADLFGEWVPDEWIDEVFKACDKAPQHNYLFLTKNPARYDYLHRKGILRKNKNMWYGYSLTTDKSYYWQCSQYNIFASIEPLLEPMPVPPCDWVIIGAETGNRKGKVIPEREWIEEIVKKCWGMPIPIFMKSSLTDIWGEPLIQELPEGLRK